jgi:hypothetical protein
MNESIPLSLPGVERRGDPLLRMKCHCNQYVIAINMSLRMKCSNLIIRDCFATFGDSQ